ncbi:hypothetical protein HMPREF0765_2161 [Sphingobacterium spiritivorum ATCC 33300]|uniref:Uncharacterized protein n=1 Tax=Sphingobacterium spiritivorum ATCC 33300 TaxID=525372 RepID=C2FXV5_SPHSI|nr:hypothetical protein [Sphingobacterium spiritivorum]EEI92234.1 hypothetical protein HMPREF0765_2161 [Sphingobacterium spiritivorum ATCC 33300]QQS96724.1 hypothetical protein I6J03_03145 [Sphingobacterium spiritivorum]
MFLFIIKGIVIGLIGLIFLICCSNASFAQPSSRDIMIDILRLREYSINYDAYKDLKDPDAAIKKNEYTKKYFDQINKIKNGPNRELYIQFLNEATGIDSLKSKNDIGYNYTYYVGILTHRRIKMPTRLEYFKVVKYSLFTMNKDELIQPKDVPFLRPESK